MSNADECSTLAPLLYDWLMEELAPAEADRVERHVTNCRRCAAEVRYWEQFHGRMTTHAFPPQPIAPPGLAAEIIQRVRLETKQVQTPVPYRRLLAWPIAVAVLMLPAIYALLLSEPGQSLGQMRAAEVTNQLLASWSAADMEGWISVGLWTFTGLVICCGVVLGNFYYLGARDLRTARNQ